MKFKVIKGSETEKKLKDLLVRINEANDAAKEYIESLGANEYATASTNYMNRRVDGIQFEQNPDKNLWREVGKNQNLYFPKVKNKEVLEALNDLPLIPNEEFNDITGYVAQSFSISSGIGWSSRMGMKANLQNQFVLDIHENAFYTPTSDIIEITNSEAKQILSEPTKES